RAIAAIAYEVEPLEAPARLVVQSELVANEPLPPPPVSNDPRLAPLLEAALHSEDHGCRGLAVELVHRTTTSGLRVAAGMDHLIDAPRGTKSSCESAPDVGRVTVTTELQPGQRLRIIKFVAYGWSSNRSRQALRDQVAAALTAARRTGWEGL